MYRRFNKIGEMVFPSKKKEKQKPIEEKDLVIDKCFCANGHNLIDENYLINKIPGIKLDYKYLGVKGEVVLSAIIGDFDKKVLSGIWEKGKLVEMFCPKCHEKLKVLTNCGCTPEAEYFVLGLTPKLDYNNSVTICNVIGCSDAHSMIKSEKIIHKTQSSVL